VGSASRESAQPARILPGTPMRKVIPPRMVGPYMNGQRGVIAGYVHRVRDVVFRNTADAFYALGLGYEGSDFKPDMAELYFLCWQAREIDGYVPVTVRSASTAGKIVLKSCVQTWQAYNLWGGYDLYKDTAGAYSNRSLVVSLDRPYDSNGADYFLTYERNVVKLAEHVRQQPSPGGARRVEDLLGGPDES